MLLILLLSCLAVAARLPLVVRLPRQSRRVGDRGDFDRAVLRDRLPELNCDVAGGMLTDSEATSVRLDIQRRLIAADWRRVRHRNVAAAVRCWGGPPPVAQWRFIC